MFEASEALLLTLIFKPFSTASFVDFKQVNVRLDFNMVLSRTDLQKKFCNKADLPIRMRIIYKFGNKFLFSLTR